MERIQITNVRDLPEKIGKSMKIGNFNLALLFKLLNGDIRAIENKCPHKGGMLSQGLVSGDYVFCPLHDWKICMKDGEVQAPDQGCVKTFRVEIQDKNVYVYV
ncbi:nitrite reductase small subunit NirD [Pseudalkalibacillus sp. A8]|uniref:nitrite reductase small subunit NirD n=1 Tax=Pseudalkalibacillus sp. A8 TaxID=3382641 RepID=UPI0038B4B6AB